MLNKQEKHSAAPREAWAGLRRDGAQWELAARMGCIVTCCCRRSRQAEELMAVLELSTEPLGRSLSAVLHSDLHHQSPVPNQMAAGLAWMQGAVLHV